MGYGKNLEEAIAAKGWSIAETARRTGVNVNTLHTIIRRDTSVRYDHALRLSNVLGIDINTICKENPYDEGEVAPKLMPDDRGVFTSLDKNAYIKHRLMSIIDLYKYSELPIIEQLLANFYCADDAGRKQLMDYSVFTKDSHPDSERNKELKKIK